VGDLTDHVAVITGASSGIGKAIALGLAAEGAALCLVGRNIKMLEAIAEKAGKMTKRALCCRADLTLDEDVLELAKDVERDFGAVDILVHSAGVISLGSFEAASIEDLDWQYRTNLRAPYFLTKNLLPMIRSCHGQIVFINSSVVLNTRANVSQYAATKHGLKAIADSLRDEVNIDEIRVLSVYLGRTATPMQAAVHKMEGKEYRSERLLPAEHAASAIVNALVSPRSTEITDLHIRSLIKP
jgi:NADP-dependent 3-hydroxy acid dehydrogenase YdfG